MRSIGGALLWMAAVVAVPYVIKRIIDEAIEGGDTSLLLPLAVALATVGLLCLAVGFYRRRRKQCK